MKMITYLILEIFFVFGLLIGCALFDSGQTVKPESIAKLETELETAKKDIDESKKEIKDVGGNVQMFEQRISTIETNVNNIQIQVSKVITYQENEPISKILIVCACIYGGILLIRFIIRLVTAYFMPGSTIKNIFTEGKA